MRVDQEALSDGGIVRVRIGAALCAALIAGLLSGCSSQGGGDGGPSQVGAPWYDEVKPAPPGDSVKACAIPVSFPLAADWLAKPVRQSGGAGDGLLTQGGATLACEIDAKPAGQIGFLRVWVGKRDVTEARPALESFLAADKGLTEISYRDLRVGDMPAVEVTYLRESPLEAAGKRERALAIQSPQGVAVVTLSGLDSDQYQAMLPAYALARDSVVSAG
ncbi:lipoprotein [Actinoplanes sp. CA-054009]